MIAHSRSLHPLSIFGCLLGFFAAAASAQVTITLDSPSYFQDFNNDWTTETSAQTLEWTNNVTIPGWYLYRNATGVPTSILTQATIGSTSTGPIYLLAHTDEPTDFILGQRVGDADGSLPATSGSGYYYAVRLQNQTGLVIQEIQVSYTGYQWYHSTGPNASVIQTSYQLLDGDSPLTDLREGAWSVIDDLTYTAPRTARPSSGSTVNFHTVAEVRTDFTPVTISDLNWQPGEDLWVRWYVNNALSTDQGVAIDNISIVAAIPEPAVAAALIGFAALGLALLRRRST